MKKSILITLVSLIALCGFSIASADSGGITYVSADESAAVRFQNLGYEDVVINIYAGDNATNSVTIGSTVTTIDMSGTDDTVAEVAAAIVAATNSAGVPVLLADIKCALGADSTDDELLDSQVITIAARVGTGINAVKPWGAILWDTSVHLSYDVYIPAAGQAETPQRTSVDIDHIYGNPLGTGAVTASIYIDGTKAWETICATNNAGGIVMPDVGIPAGTDSILVRVAPATTATTGMIGVKTTQTVYQ